MSMVKDFVRNHPALYDRARRLKRVLAHRADPSYEALARFSRARDGRVNFVQIGANDGLRNDPLRPFIVGEDWRGVLVEPLPTVFPLLKRNYAYLEPRPLVFLNAAVAIGQGGELPVWTVKEEFLAALPGEERLDYLRKASFDRDHVLGFLPREWDPDEVLEAIPVPCLEVEEIVRRHLPRQPLHLLAIDVEGYESTLIPGIDFTRLAPEAVFFEVEHLDTERDKVFGHLRGHGYRVEVVGLDAMAIRD